MLNHFWNLFEVFTWVDNDSKRNEQDKALFAQKSAAVKDQARLLLREMSESLPSPRWLLPGCFYKHQTIAPARSARNALVYPFPFTEEERRLHREEVICQWPQRCTAVVTEWTIHPPTDERTHKMWCSHGRGPLESTTSQLQAHKLKCHKVSLL